MITSFRTPDSGAATRRNRNLTSEISEPVRLLPDAAMDARLRRLQSDCELLADGFDGLDEQIEAYVACTPMPTGDVRGADADRFLDWLERHADLDDEQRDFVAALRGRRAVEFVAVVQRLAHARFQELLRHTNARLDQLATNDRLTVYLNPIHVWSQFETRALLDEGAEIPATVLFVPCGSDVRTIVVEPAAGQLINDLDAAGPLQIKDLLRRTPRDQKDACMALVRQLAAVGVVALA
jgi:hypothetical protein